MLSRIIGEILTYSQETKTVIGVRKRNSESQCWVGYIVSFNDELFVLQHVTSTGLEDGLVVEEIDNIENFETDDGYVKAIQALYEQKAVIAEQTIKSIDITTEENWQYGFLQSGCYQGRLITVEINNSDSISYGFVLDYDDTTLQLTIVDKIGEEDGTQSFPLTDITSITIDRIEGRKREALHVLRKKGKNQRKQQ